MSQVHFDQAPLMVETIHFNDKGQKINPPQYLYQEFPKVLYYQKTEDDPKGKFKPKTVKDKAAQEKLGKDWGPTPVREQDADTRDPQDD